MSVENTQPILKSFSLGSRFQNGKSIADPLQPPSFSRKPTLSLKTWRSEALNSTLDWGSENFVYEIPQSTKIVSSIYLKIKLPELASGAVYRKNPGLYCLKSFHLRSGGNIVYECQLEDMWRSCLESFADEQDFQRYCDTYLGGESVATKDARTVMIVLPIPNSHLMLRRMQPNGIFPTETNRQAIECVFSMQASSLQGSINTVTTPTIQNQCSIEIHTVEMADSTSNLYRSKLGSYSVVAHRHMVLKDWTSASANVEVELNLNSPTGNVLEFTVLAVPAFSGTAHRDPYNTVLPIAYRVESDGIVVVDRQDEKIKLENYSQGFRNHAECKAVAHVVFGTAASNNSSCYAGSYNFRQTSSVKLFVKFAQNVEYKVVSVALQSIQIQSSGLIKAFLD